MVAALIGSFNRNLRKIRSGKILNKIGAGKRVFFENPLEGIAFKYIPGEIGRLSTYYVRHSGQDEYEIDRNSSSILAAVMEGKPISKARYDHYNFIESVFRVLMTPETHKAVGS